MYYFSTYCIMYSFNISYIHDIFRYLEHLDLLGLELIDGHGFDLLPEKLPRLTFLSLVQCNRVSYYTYLLHTYRMPQLTAINYYHEDFRTAM